MQNSAPQRSSSPRCFKTSHVLRRVWSRVLSFFCNFYEPKLVVPANKKTSSSSKLKLKNKSKNKKNTRYEDIEKHEMVTNINTQGTGPERVNWTHNKDYHYPTAQSRLQIPGELSTDILPYCTAIKTLSYLVGCARYVIK